MSPLVYIYALRDPRNSYIRYVGKTNNLNRRFNSHIQRAKTSTTHSSRWIYSLIKLGIKPIIDILEICNSENWEAGCLAGRSKSSGGFVWKYSNNNFKD